MAHLRIEAECNRLVPHHSSLSTSQPDPEWKSEARFAMESSCFCVICGSPFDLAGDLYNLDVEAAHYKWMRGHRLIGSRHDVHHHNLAGLSEDDFYSACYNASDSPDVFLSAKSTWDNGNDHLFHIDGLYPDTNIPYTIAINTMQRVQDYDTVFSLHEGCLQISRRVIDHLQPVTSDGQSRSSLSVLNGILQSRYRKNAKRAKPDSFIARNDLFDLCTATDADGPRSVVGLSLLEWWAGSHEKYYTNPMCLDNTEACVHSLLKDTVSPEAPLTYFAQQHRASSGIECLPVELLSRISTHLAPTSALALHRASKTLAIKVPMDNHFWRTTIMNGTALPYLWDLDMEAMRIRLKRHMAVSTNPGAMWDWKSVGQLLARKFFPLKSSDQRITDLPDGLWNRRRIWSIVEEAYADDFGVSAGKYRIFEERKRREPVFDWQVEDIMEDLGHYS